MASLLVLLDDIATIMDDVAVLTKMTAKKAAGVLGDDLALNAQQVSGVAANRELPVVWAVAKGSFLNKLILVPLALLLNAFLPWLVTPLLMLGGAFLCYEGAEKVLHHLMPAKPSDDPHPALTHAALTPEQLLEMEADKIKGAIKTDFILSAEIIVIALGVVKAADFWTQLGTLSVVAVMMTVGVYALVGGIIKLDDLGFYLSARASAVAQSVGQAIVFLAPWLMKALSVVGTAAMFLVGGEILAHGFGFLHHAAEAAKAALGNFFGNLLFSALVGLVAGVLLVGVISTIQRVMGKAKAA